ncbi:MAG: hypothetical protein KGD65_06165 [Candidatus Lokiarchaeota archaeon]|nr:hypothetical protein [Candidatus Lokiarchaeota archaeon]
MRLKQLTSAEINAIFSDLSSLEFNLIKMNMRIMKKWEDAKESSYYINGIKEFFEEVECDFSLISHFIYGHSHICGFSTETILSHEVEIINDGAGQYTQPVHAEIHHSGKIYLK